MALDRTDPRGEPIRDYELVKLFNEVGVSYGRNVLYDEAETWILRSIEQAKALEDYDETTLNWPGPNLGFIPWIRGRLREAENVLRDDLAARKRLYGVDDVKNFITGKILHALGNVLVSQDRLGQGLDYHHRTLRQYQATQGPTHFRTAAAAHRLADHFIRLKRFSEAEYVTKYGGFQSVDSNGRHLIKQALSVFNGRSDLRNELARTTFKEAQLYLAKGEGVQASTCFKKAYELRCEILPGDTKVLEEVQEEDYDELVIFWSR